MNRTSFCKLEAAIGGRTPVPCGGPRRAIPLRETTQSSIDGHPDAHKLVNRSLLILSGSIVLLLAQAFIPAEHFLHRADDAYYYFQVALNYPRLGFWSFDGIHPTNGVQPLWAILLTSIAQTLAWVDINGPEVVTRIFVAVASLLNFASAMVLFQLVSKTISTGTAIAAAGAFLFPLGIVWARVWGMENSLYAFLLVSTLGYFHLVHMRRPAKPVQQKAQHE